MVAPAQSPRARSEHVYPLWVGTHVSESGYRGVYRHSSGLWRARAKAGGRLREVGPLCPTPADAALYVAAWYEAAFGPGWAAFVGARRRNPWRAWYSPSRRGWLLRVWEDGRPVEVPVLDRHGRPTPRLRVFPTEAAARRGVWSYFRARWGLLFHFGLVVPCRGRHVPRPGATMPLHPATPNGAR